MLLDQFVTWIGVGIKAKTLVEVRRGVIAPAIPLSRIIGQRKGKADIAFWHAQLTFSSCNPDVACSISSGAKPVFLLIETLERLPAASTATSSTWLALY